MFLLNDLQEMGTSKIIWHMEKIADFIDLNPKECDVFWEIILACKESENEVKDVFIFVEDDADIVIEKLANEDLYLKESFREYLNNYPANSPLMDLSNLRQVIQKINTIDTKEEIQKTKLEVIETDKSVHQKDASISSIRVSSDKLDALMNLVSELVTTQARLSLYSNNNIAQSELSVIG